MRWLATIFYRAENGLNEASVYLAEIEDLHDIVERGPHWDTIESIEIKRINHLVSPDLTVEAAEKM